MDWNPGYNPSRLPGWDEAIGAWLVHLAAWGKRAWTLTHYGDEARRFAAWAESKGLGIHSVERVHIEDYVVHIRDTRELGGRSIAARLTAIRQLFTWLADRGIRPDNPTTGIRNPSFRKPLYPVLSPDELEVLLELPNRRTDGPIRRRDAALLRTLAWTALRCSEASALCRARIARESRRGIADWRSCGVSPLTDFPAPGVEATPELCLPPVRPTAGCSIEGFLCGGVRTVVVTEMASRLENPTTEAVGSARGQTGCRPLPGRVPAASLRGAFCQPGARGR